jgi:maleylacetoacetate isomerase
VPVNLLTGEQRGDANLARNRQGLVPTLAMDGATLTQSLAILEYLNESQDAGFLPADPLGRARVRALTYAVAMEIAPICNLTVRNFVAEASGGTITTEAWQHRFIGQGLAALDRMLDDPATGTYCHGDQVTLADICLIPQIYNARRIGMDVASFVHIAPIVARLESLPAFVAAHPDHLEPKG